MPPSSSALLPGFVNLIGNNHPLYDLLERWARLLDAGAFPDTERAYAGEIVARLLRSVGSGNPAQQFLDSVLKSLSSPPAVFDTSEFDVSSMVPGDLSIKSWGQEQKFTDNPTVSVVTDPTDGRFCRVNVGKNATGLGRMSFIFTALQGCTSVQMTVRMRTRPGSTPARVLWNILDPTTDVQVGSGVGDYTTSASFADYSVTTSGLTPGNSYRMTLYFNNAAQQADPDVKLVRVKPLTGAWSGDFCRYDCGSSHAERDGYITRVLNRAVDTYASNPALECTHVAAANTGYIVDTNATVAAVEVTVAGTSPFFAALQDVNDALVGAPALANGSRSIVSYPGLTGSLVQIGARVSLVGTPSTSDGAPLGGAYPRAIYVGPCTQLRRGVPTYPAAPRPLVVHDSIGEGQADTVGFGTFERLRKAGRLNAVLRGCGAAGITSIGSTSGQRQAWVDSLPASGFDSLFIQMGTNDYGLNLCSAADFGTFLGDMIDRFHTRFPSLPVRVLTPTSRTNETTNNSLGSNLPQFRTAAAAVVSARSSYCALHDGTTILTNLNTQTDDDLHPNVPGSAIYLNAIAAIFGV